MHTIKASILTDNNALFSEITQVRLPTSDCWNSSTIIIGVTSYVSDNKIAPSTYKRTKIRKRKDTQKRVVTREENTGEAGLTDPLQLGTLA